MSNKRIKKKVAKRKKVNLNKYLQALSIHISSKIRKPDFFSEHPLIKHEMRSAADIRISSEASEGLRQAAKAMIDTMPESKQWFTLHAKEDQ